MPNPAVIYGTGLVSTETYPYSITIDSTEVAPGFAELDTIEFDETGDDDPGYCRMRLWDPSTSLTIREQSVVRVHDNTLGAQVFLGNVIRRRAIAEAVGRYIEVEAVSASAMLDELLVPNEVRPPESDRARVLYLWGKFAKYPLNPEASLVQQTNASVVADAMTGMTLRSALTQTAGLAGTNTRYYIDALGRLVWRSGNGASSAPFNINVAIAPGGGNIAPEALSVTRDGVIKNRLYVRAATVEASGWYQDDGSVATYGPREDYVDAPTTTTTASARTIAQLQLGKTAAPNIRAEFTALDPDSGWRADQNVTVTSAADDLAAEVLRIVKVTTTFWRGDGKRRYRISAGKTGARLSGIPSAQPPVVPVGAGLITGTITGDDGTTVVSTATDTQSGGLGPTLRRFITSGVYNGDFAAAPQITNSAITADNPLPFWSIANASGNKFTAISQTDSLAASGRSISMTLRGGTTDDPGTAGDEGYLYQLIPVNGSQGQSFAYRPGATVKTGASVNGIEVFAYAVFYRANGTTSTGTATVSSATTTSIGANTLRELYPLPNTTGIVPTDAYWMMLRVGLRRAAAATTDTVTVTLHETRLIVGGVRMPLADDSAPTTYAPANVYQSNGIFWLYPNFNGGTGHQPALFLSALDGTVELRNANGAAFELSRSDSGQYPYIGLSERTDPGNPTGDRARLYARDNGAGKTQLVVVFSSGAVQVIATQP